MCTAGTRRPGRGAATGPPTRSRPRRSCTTRGRSQATSTSTSNVRRWPTDGAGASRTVLSNSGGEQLTDPVVRSGRREVVALAGVAADRPDPVGLPGSLDALDGDGQPQGVAQPDERGEDRLVGRVGGGRRVQALDERAGELQLVYRQGAQVRQVAVPGAEVVDGDPYPEPGQGAQRVEGGFVGGDHGALQDLQLEPVRRQ